jgi:hypothetical protein
MKHVAPSRIARLAEEFHAELAQGTVAFLKIAGGTAGDHIGPNGFAALRPWNDVIDGDFVRCAVFTTVLALVFVAEKDVFSSAANHSNASDNVNIGFEANDTGLFNLHSHAANDIVVF